MHLNPHSIRMAAFCRPGDRTIAATVSTNRTRAGSAERAAARAAPRAAIGAADARPRADWARGCCGGMRDMAVTIWHGLVDAAAPAWSVGAGRVQRQGFVLLFVLLLRRRQRRRIRRLAALVGGTARGTRGIRCCGAWRAQSHFELGGCVGSALQHHIGVRACAIPLSALALRATAHKQRYSGRDGDAVHVGGRFAVRIVGGVCARRRARQRPSGRRRSRHWWCLDTTRSATDGSSAVCGGTLVRGERGGGSHGGG